MSIDWWTLGFQTVNVVVLVWLLRHFFWRPVAAIIEQRRASTETAMADAKAGQDKAAAALAEVAATRAGFGKERAALLAAAHTQAETAAKATLAAAATEAAARTAAAHAATLAEHEAAAADWTDRASQLAVQIAGRLAARLQGPAVSTAFLEWLVASIQAMPAPARQAAIAGDGAFEAVSARPLAPAEQAQTRSLIGTAFGGQPQMTFSTDPALLAGIELHGAHFVLNNSWRADLARILQDIRDAPGR